MVTSDFYFFFFPLKFFFHDAPKVTIVSYKRNLAKSGYKKNRKKEILRILLDVGEPLQPISCIWGFFF